MPVTTGGKEKDGGKAAKGGKGEKKGKKKKKGEKGDSLPQILPVSFCIHD